MLTRAMFDNHHKWNAHRPKKFGQLSFCQYAMKCFQWRFTKTPFCQSKFQSIWYPIFSCKAQAVNGFRIQLMSMFCLSIFAMRNYKVQPTSRSLETISQLNTIFTQIFVHDGYKLRCLPNLHDQCLLYQTSFIPLQ